MTAAIATDQDPKLQPGAYIRQDGRLYEVMGVDALNVTLENCVTGYQMRIYRTTVLATYFLVKPAPVVEDTVPDGLLGQEAA